MGQYADDIIDGNCDAFGDYTYKYNQQYSRRHKETKAEKNIRRVRKELALLIERFKEQNKPNPVNNARRYINLKYGHGWRERGLVVNDEEQWKSLEQYTTPDNFEFR